MVTAETSALILDSAFNKAAFEASIPWCTFVVSEHDMAAGVISYMQVEAAWQ